MLQLRNSLQHLVKVMGTNLKNPSSKNAFVKILSVFFRPNNLRQHVNYETYQHTK